MGGMPYLDAERELVACFWFAREGGDAMKSKPVVIGLVGLVVVGAASALAFGWLTSPLGGNQEVTIGPHTVVSHPTKNVVPATDVLDEATVQPSPEFLVEYAFGSGTDGFDILKVHADGSAEFQYWDSSGERTVQKTTQFQVSSNQLEKICAKLNQSKFMALDNEYHADPPQGTQIAITVVSGHVEKEVFCMNHFPVAVVQVADYLEKEIIEPNRGGS